MKENKLITNLAWKFGERMSAQLISLIVSIILARLLAPEHYGVISIVMIFIALADVLVNDGLGSALIQKKDTTAIDYFSVLYFNIGVSAVLYVILFCLAPFVTAFYGQDYIILTPVLRVLGIKIIFSAINSVQQAYVSKQMIFRKNFVATISGTIVSAVVGIAMAFLGYGVWALVVQHLLNTFVNTLSLTIVLRKKPQLLFSFDSLKNLFPYGIRILGSGLLITGYQELRALIIGKIYSSSDLAFYDKGRQFPNLIVTNINVSIGAVLFPKMSYEQDDKGKIKNTTRNAIRFSSYIMCPLMLGLAAVSESFVRLILTDKWLPCVPIMQMFCIIYLFQPMHTANMQAIKAIGRSDVYLKLEVIKKIIELISLVLLMKISVEAIVIGMAVCTTLFTFINAFPNSKLINYSFKEQMADLLPSLTMSLCMFVLVKLIGRLHINEWIIFAIQIVAGFLIYIVLSVITRNKEFIYFIRMAKRFFNSTNGSQV